jgi:glycine/D-amino acid oxidase-like deaminating enzyme
MCHWGPRGEILIRLSSVAAFWKSVAYGLLEHRQSVAVIDEGDIAHRASRGTFGPRLGSGQGTEDAGYARWTRKSVELWPAFARELSEKTGIDVAYSHCGGYKFAFSEQNSSTQGGV